MKSVKEDKRAAKAAAIEATALKLFIRHGFRKVTMSDIAAACKISRPSLYAVFANKEAVFASIVTSYAHERLARAEQALLQKTGAKARLECIFEVWVIEPFPLVLDSEGAAELSRCAAIFAPEATALVWQMVESQIVETLRIESGGRRSASITELAHVLTLAAKAAEFVCESVPDLSRLSKGLIGMALASLEKINS